jgi:hypothetical protein
MGDSTENTGGDQIKIGLIGGSGLADVMRAKMLNGTALENA